MIIGIYGYIGAGKTSACKYLQNKYNFNYLSADKIAKEIMQESAVLFFLKHYFPKTVINNTIDKNRLREIIFTNKASNTKLNNYLWLKINKKITTIVNNNSQQNLLIEAININTLKLSFKNIIFITANKTVIINRVIIRDKQSSGQTKKILKIQKTFFKQIKPNYKITSNSSLFKFYKKLDKIMKKILGDKQ